MKKLTAALILDNVTLSKWEVSALEEASDLIDIRLILNCKNTKTKKALKKNFLYYVLNVIALKNSTTKLAKYQLSDETVIDFDSIYEGNWQKLPKPVIQQLYDEKIDVVIKFGMSLLTIDEQLDSLPILSFHHGDPSKFRGRPAGFYELLYDEDKSGLIVQKLSNKLDGGSVLAFAESRLVHHSYKKTAEAFYQQSRSLLRTALVNLKADRSIVMSSNGKNYRLPSNYIVLQFFIMLLNRKLKRLAYGAFFEKKWQVGTVKLMPDLRGETIIDSAEVQKLAIEPKYTFYADPFFSLDGSKIRLEALGKNSGLGDILEIDLESSSHSKVLLTGAHYSYPFSFLLDGQEQLLPEVSIHSPQYFFNLTDDQQSPIAIKGLEHKRLADATLLKHKDLWYLFFGEDDLANSTLNLWVSTSIKDKFEPHPSSPICLSPSSARMAGRILVTDDGIFRFGQNNNRAYGAAITIAEITTLSAELYQEAVCGSIKINDCLGPHSIDFNKAQGLALIDYYVDEFSLFAGVRRLKGLLSKD